ncbi:hypothetical protein OH738_07270 [Streptomyces hirsutus]|uniref:hypothetical protein n=1 Tax=Streptomyces hirsutus TaxID=35620 RepID=UPI00386E113C|nr:hypothetical protein OH738_07270 [Streptomyces hirsutus]
MQVEVDEATGRTLHSMAAIRGWSIGAVVTWLLDQEVERSSGVKPLPVMGLAEVEVFSSYRRVRVEAILDRTSRSVKITSGPLVGRSFASPSAAAKAVVEALNPECRNPERNGLLFWRLADGQKIKQVLP